jgi:hypothetical protein
VRERRDVNGAPLRARSVSSCRCPILAQSSGPATSQLHTLSVCFPLHSLKLRCCSAAHPLTVIQLPHAHDLQSHHHGAGQRTLHSPSQRSTPAQLLACVGGMCCAGCCEVCMCGLLQ